MTTTRPHDPTAAMRTAMATVTATMLGDHDRAQACTQELEGREARFAVLVLAEYLAQALRELSVDGETSAGELWQSYCLRTEQAIGRAGGDAPPPAAPPSAP